MNGRTYKTLKRDVEYSPMQTRVYPVRRADTVFSLILVLETY